MKVFVGASLFLFFFCAVCIAQRAPIEDTLSLPPVAPLVTQSPIPTLLASVKEVNLVFSVTDHRGRFMSGLQPSDLTVLDNDQKQNALTFFQHQTDLPLDVAILIDSSSSVIYRFAAEQHTIKNFIKHVARRNDRISVFAFNEKVRFVAQVSDNNWRMIARSVQHLKPGGDTALFDAITTAAQAMGKDHRPARRIMILLTDGADNVSTASLSSAIGQVLKSEASIYAVNVSGLLVDDQTERGEAILRQLAEVTGGRYFHNQSEDGSNAFENIQRELRSQYALAYKPTNLGASAFHHIQVIAPRRLLVRCRSGYYAEARE